VCHLYCNAIKAASSRCPRAPTERSYLASAPEIAALGAVELAGVAQAAAVELLAVEFLVLADVEAPFGLGDHALVVVDGDGHDAARVLAVAHLYGLDGQIAQFARICGDAVSHFVSLFGQGARCAELLDTPEQGASAVLVFFIAFEMGEFALALVSGFYGLEQRLARPALFPRFDVIEKLGSGGASSPSGKNLWLYI
jgi:hypothetical protein